MFHFTHFRSPFKNSRMNNFWEKKTFIAHSSRWWNSKARVKLLDSSGAVFHVGHWYLLSVFSHDGKRMSSHYDLLFKGLVSFMKAQFVGWIMFKVFLLSVISLQIEFQCMDFGKERSSLWLLHDCRCGEGHVCSLRSVSAIPLMISYCNSLVTFPESICRHSGMILDFAPLII